MYPDDSGILLLTGEDARDLLNRLSTNLIDPDAPAGEVAVTVLTSDRGRIVDLVHVIHCGDHQVMLTSPGQQQNVTDFLDKYTIMEDLEVEDITDKTSMLRLTGPDAADMLAQGLGRWHPGGGSPDGPGRPGAAAHPLPAGRRSQRRRAHRRRPGGGRRGEHQRGYRRGPAHRPGPAGPRQPR